MSDRGMKKWLPFSSLVEQGETLKKMLYEKNKISKPLVSIERARKIDTLLKDYNYLDTLHLTIFFDGYLYEVNKKIVRIDLNKKIIVFDNYFIKINDIIDIEANDPFFDIC
ncbi:MAG TPA: YolD-like family protein [Candidatus Onthovivens sp.]|nr:YolD-like family protein [Candidatus Onthovivens sp.]